MKHTEARGRAAARDLSGGRCVMRRPGICHGSVAGVQHRVKRGQGGLWSPANLLDACGSGTTGCHGWTEHHPEQARELGWSLLPWQSPLEVPALIVTVNGPAWWLLGDDGLATWLAAPDGPMPIPSGHDVKTPRTVPP